VFRLVRPLSLDLLSETYGYDAFDQAEVEAAFTYSLSLSRPAKRPNIRAAKAKLFLDVGDWERARAELARCRAEGLSFQSDLGLAAELLDARERSAATTRAAR
jgi:hypothetical protein